MAEAHTLRPTSRLLRWSRRSPWLTLLVLCSTLLVVNLDSTVLNVALPTLVRDLNATSSDLQWIVDAYALVFGGLLLVAGSLGDRIGRKRTFVAGLAAFAAGSAWAAFAGSVGMLIAARASMGIGAALMMPSTLAIIADVFPDGAQRQRAIGVWAGTSGVGFALGPIIGGLLLAHYWWGSIFLINVPIAIAALFSAVLLVPDSKNPAARRPDVVGALLSIAGIGLVLWAIIEAPANGWSSLRVAAPGAAGLALMAGFAAWERSSSHPMLNLRFFRARSFSCAVSSMGLVAFGLIGSLFALTQFLQFNLGYSALDAGVRMLPIAAAVAVVSPMSALLVRIAGHKLITAGGMLVIGAGLLQASQASVDSGYLGILPGLIMAGIGAGLAMPSVSGSVISSVPRAETGVGSATNGTFMQIGGAMGVAVVGSLLSSRYQSRMSDALAQYHVPAGIQHTILDSVGSALAVAERIGGVLGHLLTHEARSAFISGSDLGMVVAAAVAFFGCFIALVALPSRPPSTEIGKEGDEDTPVHPSNPVTREWRRS
jgi:EmrB/QacA subfamily drug resistance transporter